MVPMIFSISAAFSRSTDRFWPKTRTTIGSLPPGDHFLDALVEIGLGLPEEARIGVIDVFYRVQGRRRSPPMDRC